MANSKLLKQAIADAKAVRETAIANAKIALEEAFTPRLQSILSKKLTAEMEGEDEDTMEEEADSSEIGKGDNGEPSAEASDAHIDLSENDEEGENEEDVSDEDADLEEGEGSVEDPTNADDAEISEEDEMESDEDEMEDEDGMDDEDELDLESIIRELEMGMEDEEEISEEEMESEEEMAMEDEEEVVDIESDEMEDHDAEMHDEEEIEEGDDMDDEIDLDEILREMGYGDDADEVNEEEEEEEEEVSTADADLEEAYSTIKTLQSTINEVNLLNAKLLYANRLFRGYNLTNEQKTKVVENLDRTSSVREVKLVFATLAESMDFTGTKKKTKKVVVESTSSKKVNSTAPKKEIISENTNDLAARFKQLANIK